MPQIYTAVTGDTLASIAARLYDGDESKAALLGAANGLINEEVQPGQMLVIP